MPTRAITAMIASASPNTKPDSEQRGRIDPERAGDPADNQIAWIRRPAFDAADVVLVDVREFCEPFLREAALMP